MLTLDLTIDTVQQTIDGEGHLTQATNPPLDLRMDVSGSYFFSYVLSVPTNTVNLSGYPPIDWPPGGGIGPVRPESLKVNMWLDSNFQGGVASYRYRDPGVTEQWTEVNSVPVRKE